MHETFQKLISEMHLIYSRDKLSKHLYMLKLWGGSVTLAPRKGWNASEDKRRRLCARDGRDIVMEGE